MTTYEEEALRPDGAPRTRAGRALHDHLREVHEAGYIGGTTWDRIDRGILAIEAEAATRPAEPPLDVRQTIEFISGELSHYDLSDDPGYIKVPTERVRAILRARLTTEGEKP